MENERDRRPQAKRGPKRTGAPRGPRRASAKRATLLRAASRLFVARGYESTTMDEIAAEADVAKGTLYHYFANKSDLLLELRREFDKAIMARIQTAMEERPAADWPGRIRAWIVAAVAAYFDMNELHDVVIYGAGMPFRNTMADSEITGQLARLIADGAEAGAWRVEDERWTATMMFYSFRGGCDEAMLGAQRAEDVPEKLYRLFLRILGTAGPQ